MTDLQLLHGNNLQKKIASLKEDIKVLSSKNCNGLYISVREHYSHASHNLSTNVVDEKMAHSFLKTVYINKLAELEIEYQKL